MFRLIKKPVEGALKVKSQSIEDEDSDVMEERTKVQQIFNDDKVKHKNKQTCGWYLSWIKCLHFPHATVQFIE